jgi:hypothetical protein
MTPIEVDYNERDVEGRVIAGVPADQLHALREGQSVTLYDPIDRLSADATVAWIKADVHAVGFDVDWASCEDADPGAEGPASHKEGQPSPSSSAREPADPSDSTGASWELTAAGSTDTEGSRSVFASPGVFISYRREDTGTYAQWLRTHLGESLPGTPVFMDLDAMVPGVDFTEAIESAVRSCAVLIAVIGPRWLTSADDDGHRMVDNPDDYVGFEIRTALERRVRVIPVLVEGASAPSAHQLPAALRMLARLNSLEVRRNRFAHDEGRLETAIRKALGPVTGDAGDRLGS